MHSLDPVDPDVDLHVPPDRGELVGHQVSVLAVIAVGGAVGALGRQLVGEAWPTVPGTFPWGTFLVNVSGSALIGVLIAALGVLAGHHRLVRPFLGVGILGGFTTFSSYAVQSHALVRSGHLTVAMAYLAGTVLAAVLAAMGGVFLVRRLAATWGRSGEGHPR